MRFEENNTTSKLDKQEKMLLPSPRNCSMWHKSTCPKNNPNSLQPCNCGFTKAATPKQSCLQVQEGGSHYHQGTIQPIEYIHANDLNFCEGNAIKYVTRNRRKNSAVEDLKKAIHYIQLQLKLMHQIDSRIEYDAVSRD